MAEDRIQRIGAMEEALSATSAAAEQLSDAVAAQVDALDALRALSTYYGSQEWFDDREADERGELPESLARGVLGEDLPYEALIDAREAALAAIEVATAMLRVL